MKEMSKTDIPLASTTQALINDGQPVLGHHESINSKK